VKRIVLVLLSLGLFVAMLTTGWKFATGNSGLIDLDLIWIQIPELELWRVILISMALGALSTAVLMGFAWLRGWLLNVRYRGAIKRLESELHEMRSLPLIGSRTELPQDPLLEPPGSGRESDMHAAEQR